MRYRLGIDLGTTFTAAAVCDVDGAGACPEMIPLGAHTTAVPSALFVAENGSFVFGDSAGRRCVTDPDRIIREFKRRIGDPIPIVVAGSLHEPHVVAARFVRWVVDQVVERKGGFPESITVTHPAAWGEHKRSILVAAIATEGFDDVELMTEPEAAAIAYATDLKVDPGSTVVVYDLGGGTFDAAVVHGRDRGRFELLGAPQGLEALGGAEFDDAIFENVQAQLADSWEQLDSSDPSVLSAVAALRRECTEAKEALSSDTETTIAVLLPGIHSRVRLTRGEFEEMIAPAIEATSQVLRRSLASAEVAAEDLAAVLLVGGSSRIPLVAQQLSEEFGRPVVADADPKSTVALGAALSGLADRAGLGSGGDTRVDLRPVAESGAVEHRLLTSSADTKHTGTARRRRVLMLTAVLGVVLLAGAGTLAFEPIQNGLLGGGARTAIGLSGPADEQAAGLPVGREGTSAAERSGKIDPWTGRPIEKDGTTTPGPDRPGAKAADETKYNSANAVTHLTAPSGNADGGNTGGGNNGDGKAGGGNTGRADDPGGGTPADTTGGDSGGSSGDTGGVTGGHTGDAGGSTGDTGGDTGHTGDTGGDTGDGTPGDPPATGDSSDTPAEPPASDTNTGSDSQPVSSAPAGSSPGAPSGTG